jgi:Flp pilus assembly protein TadG
MTLSRLRLARSRRHSRGQSLAEFALVFPILMLIIGGIIQFGVIFWGQNTLNQVVRDTGRWAATQTDCNPSTATTPIENTAAAIASQSALIGSISSVTVNWTVASGSACPPKDNQEEAWVHIRIDSQVPIFFPFVPGSGAIFSETEFRMEPLPA